MAIADDGFAVDYFFAVFSHRVSSVGSGIELCQFFLSFSQLLGELFTWAFLSVLFFVYLPFYIMCDSDKPFQVLQGNGKKFHPE